MECPGQIIVGQTNDLRLCRVLRFAFFVSVQVSRLNRPEGPVVYLAQAIGLGTRYIDFAVGPKRL